MLFFTAERGDHAPFAYLTALQKSAASVAAAPGDWMPWSYAETLARLGLPPSEYRGALF